MSDSPSAPIQDDAAEKPTTVQPITRNPEAITGVGVDLVEIARIEEILQRSPSFVKRVFTEEERSYCERTPRPSVHYATHFAANEAVLKALGTGFTGMSPRDVEVVHDASGKPGVVLHGNALELAGTRGIVTIHISLSRTRENAVANAIAATQASRPSREKSLGPREQLAASFKELRSLLDEMDSSSDSDDAKTDMSTAASRSRSAGKAQSQTDAAGDAPISGEDRV